MKKFTIPCDFGGKKAPFDVYIGLPSSGHHPLEFQSLWLAEERGGVVPGEVMESFKKLLDLSEKNGVSFEDLCVYALEAANEEKKKNQEDEINNVKEKSLMKEDIFHKGQVLVLASAEQLSPFFDSAFNLLFVVTKDNLGNPGHAVLLTHTTNTTIIDIGVKTGFMTLEKLTSFGQLKAIGTGVKLPSATIAKLREEYHF